MKLPIAANGPKVQTIPQRYLPREACGFRDIRVETSFIMLEFTDWFTKWWPCLLNFWQEGCIWFSYHRFPESSGNIAIAPAHSAYISQLIRWYIRTCHDYDNCFSRHPYLQIDFSTRAFLRENWWAHSTESWLDIENLHQSSKKSIVNDMSGLW